MTDNSLALIFFCVYLVFWMFYHYCLYYLAKDVGMINSPVELFTNTKVMKLILSIFRNDVGDEIRNGKYFRVVQFCLWATPIIIFSWFVIVR